MLTMNVVVDQGLAGALRAHAAAALPEEACGLVAGVRTAGACRLHRLIPAVNRAHSARRFVLDPLEYARAEQAARLRGEAICAVFHSHPDAPPEPSTEDAAAAWPEHVQLILGRGPGGRPELAAYRRTGAGLVRVDLVLAPAGVRR